MIRCLNSFYGKISCVFLVLLILSGGIQIGMTLMSYRTFAHESDQRLNQDLAGNLAAYFEPHLTDSLHYEAIGQAMHDFMVINPHVEIYILDDRGHIMAYFAEPEKIKRSAVDIGPVERFIAATPKTAFPLYGDDPRDTDRRKPFSTATIRVGDQAGYLYVILGGEQYDSEAAMIVGSYITRTTLVSLIISLLCTGVLGLILFFKLTRRLHDTTAVVQAFADGRLEQRLPEQGRDELSLLSRAFNRMADLIVEHMARLKETDRQRRDLTANISHDLRSPLTSIQGYLETILIKKDHLEPAASHRFLSTIYKNVQSLTHLVEDFFELSKLEARQSVPQPEPFSIEDLVQDVLQTYEQRALSRRITLSASPPQALPLVHADIAMIERTLANLIDNALRHTPSAGRVEIQLDAQSDGIRVLVADTGCGISSEDLPHLFDRYYRSESQTYESDRGSGLGLTICCKLIEAHDRTLSVQSLVDQGTTFSFSLPVYAHVSTGLIQAPSSIHA